LVGRETLYGKAGKDAGESQGEPNATKGHRPSCLSFVFKFNDLGAFFA